MRILPKMHPLKLQKNTQGKFYAVTACGHQKIKISVRGHGVAASGHLARPGPRPLLQWGCDGSLMVLAAFLHV